MLFKNSHQGEGKTEQGALCPWISLKVLLSIAVPALNLALQQ